MLLFGARCEIDCTVQIFVDGSRRYFSMYSILAIFISSIWCVHIEIETDNDIEANKMATEPYGIGASMQYEHLHIRQFLLDDNLYVDKNWSH